MDQFKKVFKGNTLICGKYFGMAKKLATKVLADSKASGMSMTKELKLVDAIIRVKAANGMGEIYIEARPKNGIDLISGFVTGGHIVVNTHADGTKAAAVNAFYPSAIQALIENKARAWRNEEKIAVNPAAANVRNETNYDLSQAAEVWPSMYSGAMRYAAQLAMGIKDNVIQYEYTFYKTHGIYMDAGVPWLIEISAYNGVLAKKLSGYANANHKDIDKEIKKKFPMIPDGKAFPVDLATAISNGSVRVLLKAEDLMAVYGDKMAFYNDCGWAFSESGKKAVNTCWNQPVDYRLSYRCEIQIVGDPGAGPKSAVLTVSSPGYLFNPDKLFDLPRSGFFVPDDHQDKIKSVEMRRNGIMQNWPADSFSAPVHCFYIGEQLQEYGIKGQKNFRPARTAGWEPRAPSAMTMVSGIPIRESEYGTMRYEPGWGAVDAIYPYGPDVPDPVMEPTGVWQEAIITERHVNGTAISYNDPSSVKIANGLSYVVRRDRDGSHSGRQVSSVVAISPKNRCSVFIATSDQQYDFFERDFGEGVLGGIVSHGTSVSIYGFDGSWGLSGSYPVGDDTQTASISYPGPGYTNMVINVPTSAPFFFASGVFDFWRGYSSFQFTVGSHPDALVIDTNTTLHNSTSHYLLSSKCWNNGVQQTYTVDQSKPEEVQKWQRYTQPSPDAFGEYTRLTSSQSAFMKSSIASKLPDWTFSSDGFLKSPQDGEDMSNITNTNSWVGYE